MKGSCGESLAPAAPGDHLDADVHTDPLNGAAMVRCGWCDGVRVGGEWLQVTRVRRVLQALAGRPIGQLDTKWVICPHCLEKDFPEIPADVWFGAAA